MVTGLTDKQNEVLNYIQKSFEESRRFPSLRSIGKAFGISLRAVQQHVIALKKKGFLNDETPSPAAYSLQGKQEKKPGKVLSMEDQSDTEIPFLGSIAAGFPTTALSQSRDSLDLSPSYFGDRKELFALTVRGDSMSGDNICDGDIAVVQRGYFQSPNFDILVLRVDHDDFTLKRVQEQEKSIVLVPSNPAHTHVVVNRDRVEIIGKLVGLIRRTR